MYWLFSTAPQAIAALVGIVFTGMFFMSGNIDGRVREDSTLAEIAEEAKRAMYKNLKVIAVLSAVTICLDLVMVYGISSFLSSPGFWYNTFFGTFVVMNASTFIMTFYYVFDVVDPRYFDRIAHNMSKKYTDGTIEPMDYLEHFIEFEKVARSVAPSSRYNRYLPLPEVCNILVSRNIIAYEDLSALRDAIGIRNLIVHGQYNRKVDKVLDDILLNITKKIKDNNPVNSEQSDLQ